MAFFVFEGGDGVGKTTQLDLFARWLNEKTNKEVHQYQDPGSTELGHVLRKLLLHSGEETPICMQAELLLYAAARAQLVSQYIRPAMAAGHHVVSDRYSFSTAAYQGWAGGLNVNDVREVCQVATSSLSPSMIFLLDMSPVKAMGRLRDNRKLDRIESRGLDFQQKLRAGYLSEAIAYGDSRRVHVIDADRPIQQIQDDIREIALSVL